MLIDADEVWRHTKDQKSKEKAGKYEGWQTKRGKCSYAHTPKPKKRGRLTASKARVQNDKNLKGEMIDTLIRECHDGKEKKENIGGGIHLWK